MAVKSLTLDGGIGLIEMARASGRAPFAGS